MDINATIIGQLISFTLFVLFTMKCVWPVIRNAIDEREAEIAAGLQNAEQARDSLENAESKASALIDTAKQQAAELIEQANKRANQMIEQAKQDAIAAADREKEKASEDIAQQIESAKSKLREEVSSLAVAGAEKILRASVDKNAHSEMLKSLSAQL